MVYSDVGPDSLLTVAIAKGSPLKFHSEMNANAQHIRNKRTERNETSIFFGVLRQLGPLKVEFMV